MCFFSRHCSGEQSGSKMDTQQSTRNQCSPVWSCYGYGPLSGLMWDLMISTYFLFYPKHTDAGVSTVIQVLCMIVKMNISATFIVAYMQAIKSSSSIFANKTYIRHIRCSSCLLPWVRCASGNVFYYKRISTQAMEIFPTPVRQSGIGFITFISQVRLWD